MTKADFIAGKYFKAGTRINTGDPSYNYEVPGKDINLGVIMAQVRNPHDDSIIIDDYHLNVIKIDDEGFEGFTYIMTKKVEVKYSFKDLVLVE